MQDQKASLVAATRGSPKGTFAFGPYRFDRSNSVLSSNGAEFSLPPRVLRVLEHLLERPGEVVSKQELLDAVWADTVVAETSLADAIKILRQALGDDPQQPTYLQTIHRRGYRFIAPVSVHGTASVGDKDEERLGMAAALANATAFVARAVSQQKQLFVSSLVSLAIGIVAGGLWVSGFGDAGSLDEPRRPTQFSITLPENERIQGAGNLTLSSDGTLLVYARQTGRGGASRLWLRAMDDLETKLITGTEGAQRPFFSPDGEWVGFFIEIDGTPTKLKKVSLTSGQVVTLCDLVDYGNLPADSWASGASWGPDGTIVFAMGYGAGLGQVSADGGTCHVLTAVDPSRRELGHYDPHFLPGGEAIVLTIDVMNRFGIAVLSLSTGKMKYLLDQGGSPRYSPSGHLVVDIDGDLWAMPFDLDRLEVTGSPVVITEGVSGPFALSNAGTLAYLPSVEDVDRSLVWVDKAGRFDTLPNLGGFWGLRFPRISPDGQRVAFDIPGTVWVYDLARGTPTQLIFDGGVNPVWSPDGEWLALRYNGDLFLMPADGSSEPKLLLETDNWQIPQDWSPDGKALLYQEYDLETGRDLWILPLDGWSPGADQPPKVSGSPIPFLRTSANEAAGAFSPDGKWIAYASRTAGRGYEVYVRPSSGSGGTWKISVSGGNSPVWSPDGRKLYFVRGRSMYEVTLQFEPEFSPSPPKRLFADLGGKHILTRKHFLGASWDIAADGERMLMIRGTQPDPPRQINVILNWFEELKQRVPTGR